MFQATEVFKCVWQRLIIRQVKEKTELFLLSPRQQWNRIRNIWNKKHVEQPNDLNF